jgi:hypothetical protein
MKVIARTPTELIIRDSAGALRAFGVFLLAFAAFAVWIGFTGDPGEVSVVPLVIGSLVALSGLALIVLPPRKTFAFSKTERVFIIAKERFGRVERQSIPLRDVVDIVLEESANSDGGGTYRVAITLADQRRIPWTSYYTSGVVGKRDVVELVREFLDLEPSPQLGSGALTAKDERDAKRGRWGLLAMGAFCCAFLGIGVTMLAKEQRRLSVYQPVEATVLSTRVDEHSDSDGSTYEPVVVYRYFVDDREYTASRVTPLKESRSGRWAHRVTSGYRVGGSYTAFYDPGAPGEAFLMRSRSVIPWGFIAIPLIGLVFIGAGIRGSREVSKMSYRSRSYS